MEELFGGNLFVIYFIACVAVISYCNFRENQRMFLLYLFTYAAVFFRIFRVSAGLALLFLATFVFLEYLSEDTQKLELIVRLRYKLYDYLFMMLFQYHFCWVLLAFLFLFASHCQFPVPIQTGLTMLSVLLLLFGAHRAVSQPFKIKSVTEMLQIFKEYPHYHFVYSEEMQRRFDLICAFEDKTYFQRTSSYSCLTREYLSLILQTHSIFALCRHLMTFLAASKKFYSPARGFSTPEMQLLRTIGIQRGYDRYKVHRKIFEVIYSKIFFSSLKEQCEANSDRKFVHYRQYLLLIYVHSMLSKIHGIRYMPLSSAFQEKENIGSWSMEGLFIACLGLSFRRVSAENLVFFQDIIQKFHLSKERIWALYRAFPESLFPNEVG